jgi:Restriction endonuclease fold toxin 9
MKNLSIFILLCFFCNNLFSQTAEGIAPMNPQNSFNQSTGTFVTGVPLLTITGDHISVPISVNYAATGVRVNQLSSNVGLGWDINTGGMITRQVNDQPDDLFIVGSKYPIGSLYWNDTIKTIGAKSLANLTADEKKWVFSDNRDKEPDLFSFSANGYSGTFRFDSYGVPQLDVKQDLKINYTLEPNFDILTQRSYPSTQFVNGGISKFTITTPDGNQFIFAHLTYILSASNGGGDGGSKTDCDPAIFSPYKFDGFSDSYPVISSWKLTRIINRFENIEIEYFYEKETYMDHCEITQSHAFLDATSSNQTISTKSQINLHHNLRLWKITYGNKLNTDNYGEVLFTPESTVRTDLFYSTAFNDYLTLNNYPKAYKLSKIELKAGPEIIKTFDFTYDNFAERTIPSPCTLSAWVTAHRKRPKLTAITEKNGNVTLPPYSFTYDNTALPPRHSTAVDFWGYFNGSNAPNFLPICHVYTNTGYKPLYNTIYSIWSLTGQTPDVTINPIFGTQTLASDRTAGTLANVQAGILTKIKSPLGGETSLTYEQNTCLLNINNTGTTTQVVTVGGLRLKQKQENDKNGNISTINYFYDTNSDGTGTTTGRLMEIPVSGRLRRKEDVLGNWTGVSLVERLKHCTVITSMDRRAFSSTGNTFITYEKVCESSGNSGGKTITKFDLTDYAGYLTNPYPRADWFGASPEFTENSPNASSKNISWRNGTIDWQISYNSSGKKVKEVDYTYSAEVPKEIIGIKTFYNATPVDNNLMYWSIYRHQVVDFKLSKITTKDYDALENFITTEVTYSYATTINGERIHHMPTSESITNGDGKVYKTVYKRPFNDINESNDTYLNNHYIIAQPIETIQFVDGVQVSGKRFRYDAVASERFSGDTPDEFKSNAGIKDYQNLDIKSFAPFFIDPVTIYNVKYIDNWESATATWVQQVEFLKYNVLGYPKLYQPRGHAQIQNNFNANNNLLLSTQVNPSGPVTWTTTYEYYPDRMLKKVTDKNGIVTEYTYDDLNRKDIVAIKNSDATPITKNSVKYEYALNLAIGWTNGNYVKSTFTASGITNMPIETTIFDGFGRSYKTTKTSYIFGSGATYNVSSTYDVLGRIISNDNPALGGITTMTYENSPLHRQKTSTAPSWTTSITTDYEFNALNEVSGYTANTLFKTIVSDENGNKSHQYRDKIGRLILNRRILSTTQNADTRYEYDVKGNVLFVLPPDVTINTSDAAFKYEYYDDNTLKYKRIPGKGWYKYTYYGPTENNYGLLKTEEHITTRGATSATDVSDVALGYEYNIFDQPIFEKNLKLTTLNVMKQYDYFITAGKALGKLKEKKVFTLQNTNTNQDKPNIELKTTYLYDDAFGRISSETVANHLGGDDKYEYTYDNRDKITKVIRTHKSNINAVALTTIITKEYAYDNTGRLLNIKMTKDGVSQQLNSFEYDAHDWVIKKNIGISVNPVVGGTPNILQQVDFAYNSRGWLTDINTLPPDVTTDCPLFNASLDRSDDANYSELGHSFDGIFSATINPNIDSVPTLEVWFSQYARLKNETNDIRERYIAIPLYDQRFRSLAPTSKQFKVDGAFSEGEAMEMCQNLALLVLEASGMPQDSLLSHSFKIDFEGQWKNNLPQVSSPSISLGVSADLFAERIKYSGTGAGTTTQNNGNITEVRWQMQYAAPQRNIQIYKYAYDKLDRMTKADYSEVYMTNPTGVKCIINKSNYNEAVVYKDLRGNIANISRTGWNGSAYVFIDNIFMTYQTDNRLATVKETALSAYGFNGATNVIANIEYDNRGNMTKDLSRNITSVVYNYFDLPVIITVSGTTGGTIVFTYDTEGNLISKTVTPTTGTAVKTDYVSGMEYTDANGSYRLQSISHEEGRLMDTKFTGIPEWRHEFVLTDHIGNARVFFSDKNGDGMLQTTATAGEVTQEAHYYPFGLMMDIPSYTSQEPNSPYLYNGIEKISDLKLNINTAFYRTLDPALGRWWQVDPKAEMMYNFSCYGAMGASPAVFNDPNGDILPAVLAAYAVGAIATGTYNLIDAAMSGKVRSVGGGLAYFTAGAISGVLYAQGNVVGAKRAGAVLNVAADAVTGNLDLSSPQGVVNAVLSAVSGSNTASTAAGLIRNTKQLAQWGAETAIDLASLSSEAAANSYDLLYYANSTTSELFSVTDKAFGTVTAGAGFEEAIVTSSAFRVSDGVLSTFATSGFTKLLGAKSGTSGHTSAAGKGMSEHKNYKSLDANGIDKVKEYGKIPGIRPDYVDFNTNTIYELKPNNPRAIAKGNRQLNKYVKEFQNIRGGTWKKVLDLY